MTRAALLAACLLLGAAGPDGPEAGILQALAAGATGIGTIGADTGGDPAVWASWTTGDPDHWLTHLALIRTAGPAITWQVARPDGYGAVLHPTGWQHAGRYILILQYQFGAAYTRMELYAARPDGGADELGNVEGALLEVRREGIAETLRAKDAADLRSPARCYRWMADHLVKRPCLPGHQR